MGIRNAFLCVGLIALFPSIIIAEPQSACANSYISGCLSTAIISACGDVSSTSCICASSGQGAIASLVGPCLLALCPITQILAIGNYATSACNDWLITHTLTMTTGAVVNGTGGAGRPTSTTFTSITTSGPGDVSMTNSPSITNSPIITNTSTIPNSPTTSISTGTVSQGLSVGAGVGIGVGTLAVVGVIVFLTFFCLRRRRQMRKEMSPESYELQKDTNISDKTDGLAEVHVVEIPRHELDGFEFPFQKPQMVPVEADSQSVRAQSRGRVAGTETTAFDFESQKVLLTPGLRDQSRASSRVPASSPASTRRYNSDT